MPNINLPIVGKAFETIGIEIANTFDDLVRYFNGEFSVNELIVDELAQELNSIPRLGVTVVSNDQDNIEFLLDYENSLSEDLLLFLGILS